MYTNNVFEILQMYVLPLINKKTRSIDSYFFMVFLFVRNGTKYFAHLCVLIVLKLLSNLHNKNNWVVRHNIAGIMQMCDL